MTGETACMPINSIEERNNFGPIVGPVAASEGTGAACIILIL
jgi:hypothetical protein